MFSIVVIFCWKFIVDHVMVRIRNRRLREELRESTATARTASPQPVNRAAHEPMPIGVLSQSDSRSVVPADG